MPRVAFRSIRSRKRYFTKDLGKRVRDLLGQRIDREVKPRFLKQFQAIVADWEHKVKFASKKYIGSDGIWIVVYPTGKHKQIWEWVTGGTRAHPISARNKPYLVFQLGYIPHTAPGGGYGGEGRAVGEWRKKQSVQHPGTAPREFEKHIARRNELWFRRKMETIWKWVIRRL